MSAHSGKRLHRYQAAVVACLVLLHTGWAAADDRFWIDDAGVYSGNFEDTDHWNATPPGISDTAIFDNNQATPYVVTFTADHDGGDGLGGNLGFAELSVRNDNVVFNLGNHTVETRMRFGINDGEVSTVVFNGTGGQVTTISSDAFNAHFGFGANTVTHVTVNSGATINGSRSPIIGSGVNADTTLDINGGHAIMGTSGVTIGPSTNSVLDSITRIIVRNDGQFTTNGNGNLASRGTGRIEIVVDDATWQHTSGTVAFGNLDGPGNSTIDITVRNGGDVNVTGNVIVRDDVDTFVNVNTIVTGGGSTFRSAVHGIGGGLSVARASNHQVQVRDGAVLGVTQKLTIYEATGAGSAGKLTLDTGIIEVDGQETSSVEIYGTLEGSGVIRRRTGSGSDLFSVNLHASGTIAPGQSPGLITIQDGHFESAGTLIMELAGTAPDQYDRIVLTSGSADQTATFTGGAIQIGMLLGYDAFRIAPGDTFDLLSAPTITGLPGLAFLDPHFAGFISVLGDAGAGQTLQLTITQVPEPVSSLALFALAAMTLRRTHSRRMA